MTEWQPIETAPKDGTKIMFFGRWKPFDTLKGGEPHITMASWSSLMSDGISGYGWYGDYMTSLESVNVAFTHWMPLPEPPK